MNEPDPNRPLTEAEKRHHDSQGDAIRYALRQEEKEKAAKKPK
ncbi:hypothetical protein [Nocardiopsis exhalans]|nr:hypothetical protein [Nocardiopsis exhalans]